MAHPAFGALSKTLEKTKRGAAAPEAPLDAPEPAAAAPSAPVPDPETEPDMTEASAPAAPDPHVRPPKKYRWVEEDDFSVEAFLADAACATLMVIDNPKGSMTITFRLVTEDDKAMAEAQTAPLMNRFFWNEQVNRWTTIAMCAAVIVKIDGKEWMKDKPLEDRIKALRKGRSVGMMDRIIGAFHEFHSHSVWLSAELDPKGS